jgi:hypothetical protein
MQYRILDVVAQPVSGDYTVTAQAQDITNTLFTAVVKKDLMAGYPNAKAQKAIIAALDKRYAELTASNKKTDEERKGKGPNFEPLINTIVGS